MDLDFDLVLDDRLLFRCLFEEEEECEAEETNNPFLVDGVFVGSGTAAVAGDAAAAAAAVAATVCDSPVVMPLDFSWKKKNRGKFSQIFKS